MGILSNKLYNLNISNQSRDTGLLKTGELGTLRNITGHAILDGHINEDLRKCIKYQIYVPTQWAIQSK